MTKFELHTPSPFPYLDWTDSGMSVTDNIVPLDVSPGKELFDFNGYKYVVDAVDSTHVILRSALTGLPQAVAHDQVHKLFGSR